jgi:hypothetical protein
VLLSAVAAGEFGTGDVDEGDGVLGHGRSSAGEFVRGVVPAGFALAVLGVFAVLAVLTLLAVLAVLAVLDVGCAASTRRDVDVVVP